MLVFGNLCANIISVFPTFNVNCTKIQANYQARVAFDIIWSMDTKITDFFKRNNVSVLTTILPDGIPHSASMHFAMRDKLFQFVFFTKAVSRKCGHFRVGRQYPASVVVGFDEKEMIEFQAEGVVKKVSQILTGLGVKTFASKFKGAKLDSEHVVLEFTPKWYRYTEYKPKKLILES